MPTLELVFYVESPLLQDFGFTMKACNGKLPVLVFNMPRILELYVYNDCNKYCVLYCEHLLYCLFSIVFEVPFGYIMFQVAVAVFEI